MQLHRPGQWFFLSPETFYFASCDSVLLGCDMSNGFFLSTTPLFPKTTFVSTVVY
jgi:hypothetical protein